MRAAGPACSGDRLRPCGQGDEQFSVDLERAGDHRGSKMQGTFHFAPAHGRGHALAEIRLADPEFLGQPKAHFQKPVIDRLQLPGQRPLWELALAPRKAGHTTNHRGLR